MKNLNKAARSGADAEKINGSCPRKCYLVY